MVTLYGRDKKPVVVDAAEAPQRIMTGELGYLPGTKIPVKVNGQVGTVDADEIEQAAAQGARTVSGDEFRRAKLQQDYGDFGHQVETYAVNTLDSASLGLSNFAAGQLGGKEVREHLRKINEANPNAALAGQVTGIVAPIAADVLTGGAATPIVGADIAATVAKLGLRGEEAVQAARAMAAGGKAIRTLEDVGQAAKIGLRGEASLEGAANLAKGLPGNVFLGPSRAVSTAGATVESGIKSLIGTEATTFAGKLAQKALPVLGREATQGALYGAGSVLSEEGIKENPDFSAGKFVASMGLGSLVGMGAGLGTMAGGKVLGALGRRFEGKSGDLLLEAIGAEGKLAKEIESLPGGKEAFRTKLLKNNLVKFGDDLGAMAEQVGAARKASEAAIPAIYSDLDRVGDALGALTGAKINRGPALSAVEEAIDRVVPKSKGGALERVVDPQASRLDDLRSALRDDLKAAAGLDQAEARAVTAAGEPVKASRPMTQEEVNAFVAKNPKDPATQQYFNSNFKDKSGFPAIEEVRPATKAEAQFAADGRMSFTQASDYASRIEKLAAEAKSPKVRDALRSLSVEVEGMLEKEASSLLLQQGKGVGDFLAGIEDAMGKAPSGFTREEVKEAALRWGRALSDVKHLRVADRAIQSAMEANLAKAAGQLGLGQSLVEGAVGAVGGAGAGMAWDLAKGREPHLSAKSVGLGALGLAGGLGRKIGMRVLEQRGASAGAVALDRLSVLGRYQEKMVQFQRELDSNLDKIVAHTGDVSKLSRAENAGSTVAGKTLQEKYQNAYDMVLEYAANEATLGHVQKVAAQWRPVSEGLAEGIERTALLGIRHLLETAPRPQLRNPAYPAAGTINPSDQEISKWLRRVDVVNDAMKPVKNLARGIPPTQEEVDTYWIAHPQVAQYTASTLASKVQKSETVPSYAVQMGTAALTRRGRPLPNATAQALASSWGGGDPQQGSGTGVFGGGSPAKLARPVDVAGAYSGRRKY